MADQELKKTLMEKHFFSEEEVEQLEKQLNDLKGEKEHLSFSDAFEAHEIFKKTIEKVRVRNYKDYNNAKDELRKKYGQKSFIERFLD